MRHRERSPRLCSHSPGWPPSARTPRRTRAAAVATGTLHPRSRSKTPPPNRRPNATALSSTPTSASDFDADAAGRVSSRGATTPTVAKNVHCRCSRCHRSGKYRKSIYKRISNFLTCSNLTILLLWIVMIILI